MGGTINPIPLPTGDPIAQAQETFSGDDLRAVLSYLRRNSGRVFITDEWQQFITQMQVDIGESPTRIDTVFLEDQSASIGATDITDGTLPAGTYNFAWFATIVRSAGATSTLTVTVDFTYRGNAKSESYAAITANTISTFKQGGGLIVIDGESPVRYSTTYGSTGVPAMLYDITFVLQRTA